MAYGDYMGNNCIKFELVASPEDIDPTKHSTAYILMNYLCTRYPLPSIGTGQRADASQCIVRGVGYLLPTLPAMRKEDRTS